MRKLLIAVDAPPLAGALTLLLQDCYEVHCCFTGTDALNLIDMIKPDALILYLSLPHIDGLTILHQCRHKPASILVLSNLITDSVIKRISQLGARGIILIPCTPEYIADSLSKIEKLPASSL